MENNLWDSKKLYLFNDEIRIKKLRRLHCIYFGLLFIKDSEKIKFYILYRIIFLSYVNNKIFNRDVSNSWLLQRIIKCTLRNVLKKLTNITYEINLKELRIDLASLYIMVFFITIPTKFY